MRDPENGPSRRQTSWAVRAWDRAAEIVITVGGLGVLAAMLGICAFLIYVAAPLFKPGSATALTTTAPDDRAETNEAWFSLLGPSGRWMLLGGDDGLVHLLDPSSGFDLGSIEMNGGGAPPTAAMLEPVTRRLFLGFGDGSVGITEIEVEVALVARSSIGARLSALAPGETAALTESERASVAAALGGRLTLGQLASVAATDEGLGVVSVTLDPPTTSRVGGSGSPIREIAGATVSVREQVLVAADHDGRIVSGRARVSRSLGGAARVRLSAEVLDTALAGPGSRLFVDASGSTFTLVQPDGIAHRLHREERTSPYVNVETVDLTEGEGQATAVCAAIGGRTILVGDSAGRVRAWTLVEPDGGGEPRLVVSARTGPGSPVRVIASSENDRTIAIGDDSGRVRLVNMTSGKLVLDVGGLDGAPLSLAIGPGIDAVSSITGDGAISVWAVKPGYPGVSARSLFGRVQYEGYAGPEYVYQSTGGPGSEPKLSLVPLIWGTLKATVVSMLVAIPLGILAAVFSSEFLHPKHRRTIKPVIELMASLPSVVLGFIAAMLLAPVLRDHLAVVIVALASMPVAVLLGTSLWRAVSPRGPGRTSTGTQLWFVFAALIAGAVGAALLAGPIERSVFANPAMGGSADTPTGFRAWLDGNFGRAWPGWVILTLPLLTPAVFLIWSRCLSRQWANRIGRLGRRGSAMADLGRVAGLLAISAGAAVVASFGLDAAGFDARDSVLGPYSQRNTLVVGLVMGLAVIPLIYTISEDAMQAVPRSLRFASLGSGATPWQTAVRVVLPVAGSGIFSACMIGLGRAVGETMIVLMATGNTPEISTNIFSGFRTLAANIAVELPEAPRGGSHYRVLFLCGLTLFAMTLVVNTTAELVRQRFRKRNASL